MILDKYRMSQPQPQAGDQGKGAYKATGQEEARITPHAPGSVGKCEGMNPHTPKATPTLGDGVPVESWWTFKSSEGDCKG